MMGDVSGTSNGMSEYPPCPCRFRYVRYFGYLVIRIFSVSGLWVGYISMGSKC